MLPVLSDIFYLIYVCIYTPNAFEYQYLQKTKWVI